MSIISIRIAAAQYPVGYLGSWEKYREKLTSWCQEAAEHGSQVLVFPEYASMELASLFSKEVQADVLAQIEAMQALHDDFVQLHVSLAQQFGCYIVAGSFPVKVADRFVNRAYFIQPDGTIDFQDKCIMTRFEAEQWGISGGEALTVFDTPLGKFGILICYDSEFPLLGHELTRQGADVLLVPSCCDTDAGYNRVRIGSQARALENQCYVVHASLVGTADWSEAIDINIGCAGFYTPVDHGFPANGILLQGNMNQAQWLYADLDLQQIATVRTQGQVFNFRDWAFQKPFSKS